MQMLLDNMVATMIAGMIFLMLVAVVHRNRMTAAESLNHYALVKQERNFIETLKKDLSGVAKVTRCHQHQDSAFVFQTQLYPNDPKLYNIKYEREWVAKRGASDLYQIKRFQNDPSTGTAYTIAGASMLTVTSWTMEARSTGEEAVDPDQCDAAKMIYVGFEAALPYDPEQTRTNDYTVDPRLGRSRWEATFRPPFLHSANPLL